MMLKSTLLCVAGWTFAVGSAALVEDSGRVFDCQAWSARYAEKYPEIANQAEEMAYCEASIVTVHKSEQEASIAAMSCPADVAWYLPDGSHWLAFCEIVKQ